MKQYVFSILIFLVGVSALSFSKLKNYQNTDSSTATGPLNEEVDQKVILEVGSEKFTVFELQKNFKTFKQGFIQKYGHEPAQSDVSVWTNDFIERAYILADARALGYYDRDDVQRTAEGVAIMILTQPNGIIESKLMDSVNADEIKKAQTSQPGIDVNVATSIVKQKAVANYHERIRIRSSVKTEKRILSVVNKALARYEKPHEIKKSDISDILNANIATYRNPENKFTALRVRDLADYYNNLPLKRILGDSNAVLGYIQDIAANAYIMNDAKKMGALDEPKFKLGKKNFTDNIVYRKYQEERLTGEINVTEDEILTVYDDVKGTMLRATQIVYTAFTFANLKDAILAQGTLRISPADTARLKNALSEKRHIKFDENGKQLIDTLRKTLIRMHPGESSFPVKTNDYYTVLFMEYAGGTKPLEIADVHPYLVALALEKRRTINRHALVAKLAEKYKKTDELNAALLAGL